MSYHPRGGEKTIQEKMHVYNYTYNIPGQITIIPKPELRSFSASFEGFGNPKNHESIHPFVETT